MPELCPHCGSDEILSDYFEDEWLYWCGHCGREIMAETEESDYEFDPYEYEITIPKAKGKPEEDSLPGLGRDKV